MTQLADRLCSRRHHNLTFTLEVILDHRDNRFCAQDDRCQAQDGMLLAFLGKLSTWLDKLLTN